MTTKQPTPPLAYDGEMLCTWPNGEHKPVMVISTGGDMANIIWNEHTNTRGGCVTGMDETVPITWLTPFAGAAQ